MTNDSLVKLWEESLPILQSAVPFDLKAAAVAVFRIGSHAHGTYVPPEDPNGVDDVDLMVVCLPPPEHVLGLKKWEHAVFKEGNLDVVFYEWSKWLRMLDKSNPNVIGTLFSEPEDEIIDPELPALEALRRHRHTMLSKRMYPSFVGYAHSQLYKMTHFAHQGYMGEKRKMLVEKYGYDVKNAAHLIRLLRMAVETLELGTLRVRRHDARELIDIKRGRWTKEQVINEANRLFYSAEMARTMSELREHPPESFIQGLMVGGYQERWKW